MLLKDQVAIVTGAAHGQGLAVARLFSGHGARVVVADIDGDAAAAAAAMIPGSIPCRVDISSEGDVTEMVRLCIEQFGRVDSLVNNAAIGFSANSHTKMAGVVDTPVPDWERVLRVNLTGPALCSKAVLPLMAEQGRGSIINTVSINALVGLTGADAYTASKGGLGALTRSLAVDWASRGVRVNAVCPVSVDTEMIRDAVADPAVRRSIERRIPLGRLARPEEIAGATLFLASDLSSYVTGVLLPVDGGWTAQ